jgi:hypothetical protein
MLDDQHNWQTLEDAQKRVAVHWYDGSQEFGMSLQQTATTALDRLQHDINASLKREAQIWIYPTQDDLFTALPSNRPEWVGGQPFPELGVILANIAADDTAQLEIKRIVPHELSHLVLYQATRNPYNTPPLWLDEGLAVHNEEVHDPVQEEALKQAAEEGRLVPLKALAGSFGADEDTARLSYAESRSAVDFMLSDSRYGPEKFAKTIAAFRDGVTYDEAFKGGLGVTVDEIDKEWQDSLPYKPGSRSAAPSGGKPTTPVDFSFRSPLVLVPLGACVALFVAGGILTLVMTARRGRARSRL